MAAALALLAALALIQAGGDAATLAGADSAEGGDRPNVVVIMSDDQDARSLRVMGAVERRIGEEGATFTNAFATFPLCCPSRATFLTGQYAHNHGVTSNRPPEGGYQAFTDPEGTMPEALQRTGYRTAHIGRYLNGYGRKGSDPRAVPPGWDEWYGFPAFEMFRYPVNHNGTISRYGGGPAAYQTDVIARLAVRFVRDGTERSEPFFLSLAPLAPHTESRGSRRGTGPRRERSGRPADAGTASNPRPAPRHRGRFADARLPMPPSFNEEDISDKPAFMRSRDRLDGAEVGKLTQRYRDRLASLLVVDDLVAKVIGALRRSGELDETLVVYTSDNGYLLGEHRRRKKQELFEESIRVPLLARGPGIPRGAEVDQLVGNVDLAPTILDAAGAEPGRLLDGRSLIGVAEDPATAADRALLLENEVSAAVRTPRFMYAEHRQATELYDLRLDPFQLHDLSDRGRYQETTARLSDLLAGMRSCAGARCLRQFTPGDRDVPLVRGAAGAGG